MKKLLHISLILVLLIICMAFVSINAQAASTSDLTFKLNSNGKSYYVAACNVDAAGALTIPATYNGKPVTEIGDAAFYNCKKLTAVSIPDSIVRVGTSAFDNCSNIDHLTIGKGLRYVGADAFDFFPDRVDITDLSAWCKIEFENQFAMPFAYNLFLNGTLVTNLVIPNDITAIKDFTFRGAYSITSLTLHDNITSIGAQSFNCCEKLSKINWGNGVKEIGYWAFAQCYSLKTVSISDSVTFLDECAFSSCHSLTSAVVPGSIAIIDEGTFEGCDNLSSVTFKEGITSISQDAFRRCKNLTKLTFPDSLVTIDQYAFAGCTRLNTIIFGAQLKEIKYNAFAECASLTTITLSRNIKSIGGAAFDGCPKLSNIYFDGSKSEWNRISVGYSNDTFKTATVHYTNPCVEGHTWNSGVVTKAATCSEEGIKTYTCTGCNTTQTQIIYKTSHNYGEWRSINDNAHSRTCASCFRNEIATHGYNNDCDPSCYICI